MISQINVLEVEGSRSCLLENSIASMHSHTCLSFMLVVVRLFRSCSMCIMYTLPMLLLRLLSMHLYFLPAFLMLICCWWFTCKTLAAFVCVFIGIFVYQACYSCWYSFCVLFSWEILHCFPLPNNIFSIGQHYVSPSSRCTSDNGFFT